MFTRTATTLAAAGAALALGTPAALACSYAPSHGWPTYHQSHHHRGPLQYVNLGDSYSAGVGLEPLVATAPAVCRQATINYAHLLASALHDKLTDVSCSGADTSDFRTAQHPGVAPQLNALNKKTDLVTMMIGGNDSSVFSNALTACSQLGYRSGGKGSPCTNTYGTSFTTTVTTKTYPALVRAFKSVRAAAPKARVAVIGYPRLMPASGGCFPQMPLATGDIAYLNKLQATLNNTIRRAAQQTGVIYVDAYTASTGHDACQAVGTRWVEPVVGGVTKEPAHPNALGEKAIATLTRAKLHLR